MRKIILLLLLLLPSFNIYGFDRNDLYVKSTGKKQEKLVIDSKYNNQYGKNQNYGYSFSIGGHGYFSTGKTKDIGNGGGVSLNFRTNLNKYLALQSSLVYTYAEFEPFMNKNNLLDAKQLFIIQKETNSNEIGIVPWFGIGFGLSSLISTTLNNFGSLSAYGVSIYAGAGIRYNFKKIFIGTYFDYTYTLYINKSAKTIFGNTGYYGSLDTSGFRINGEVGFRF